MYSYYCKYRFQNHQTQQKFCKTSACIVGQAECQNGDKSKELVKNMTQFQKLVRLRALHYPIQYLCGEWPFRDLDLILQKPVLIPRFESEYMISLLISKIQDKYSEADVAGLKFVEFGCGSGALGLSLMKELKITGCMIDINPVCTNLTRKNIIKNKMECGLCRIIEGDMAEYLQLMEQSDIIISNPPYLSQLHYKTILKPQIKQYEDKNALVAEDNGLKFVAMILKAWQNRHKKGIAIVEFDGRVLLGQLAWANQFVLLDQYNRRRFLLLQK